MTSPPPEIGTLCLKERCRHFSHAIGTEPEDAVSGCAFCAFSPTPLDCPHCSGDGICPHGPECSFCLRQSREVAR